MKIIKYSLFALLITLFIKCSPDDNGTFGEKTDRNAQLIGTWKIEKVYQIDLDAEKKSFPGFATKVDITNAISNMPFSDFEIEITAGTITTKLGMSPMGSVINEGEGTWDWITNDEVNNVNQELGINASKGINTIINNMNVALLITTYDGITNTPSTLSLQYNRTDDIGNNVIRYEYILAKQ